MRTTRSFTHQVWARREPAEGDTSFCVLCGHPIRHYPFVGWVDLTPAVHGGTYDMCSNNDTAGNHLAPE